MGGLQKWQRGSALMVMDGDETFVGELCRSQRVYTDVKI